jgi:hypothetical protein
MRLGLLTSSQLVIAPHSELAAAGGTELHTTTLARDAVPDHGEGAAHVGNRRPGGIERSLRQAAEQLVVLATPAASSSGSAPAAIATLAHAGLKRNRGHLDSNRTPLSVAM